MNLLAKAKSSARLFIPSPSSRKHPFFINHITSLQQSNLYSTKITDKTQKAQQSSNPKTQKSSEPASSFSQRVKKQVEELTLWARPREIPYQAKVANFVNIIGRVKIPVKFETSSDGKHWAATIISQDKNSLLIPVVFEGDLAHVVARHVKENDCVFVSGQLSVDPVRLVLSESLGKFHVVAENLNFVEGLKMTISNYTGKKKEVATSDVEMDKPFSPEAKTLKVNISSESGYDGGDGHASLNSAWRDSLEHSKMTSMGRTNERGSGNSAPGFVKSPVFDDSEAATPVQSLQGGNKAEMVFNDNSKLEKEKEMSGGTTSKHKDGDSWRDLVINPLQWWDYREHKSNGLVKEKFPDFKHKATGESLWINGAPEWVLAGLGKLEFDVKPIYAKKQQPAGPGTDEIKRDEKGGDSWKNLVENPDKWWDNRPNKKNPKAPDFKHKETGEVLWLNRSPDWALSRLPPLRDGQISRSF
ncbi:protein OSB2, chloroplastic-like [Henckelia pumila]|uniref:protein OSB2, chloroplastic-like n=1 Tax=Henckelia pumila TaxID=405737 RepID=UPI003C6E453C